MKALNILFICTGNICRSPMAEALFRSKLIGNYPSLATFTEAVSAGASAIEGNPATYSAIQAMDLWGMDIEPHQASVLTMDHLEEADLILTMAREHLLTIGRLHPPALAKSTTLRYLAGFALKICDRLGDETVRSEREARKRIGAVLAFLRKLNAGGDFLADVQSPASDIIDPIGSSLQVYLGVAEEIETSLGAAMQALFGRPEALPARSGGS